jgi:plasmid stabilization system protein ParE
MALDERETVVRAAGDQFDAAERQELQNALDDAIAAAEQSPRPGQPRVRIKGSKRNC